MARRKWFQRIADAVLGRHNSEAPPPPTQSAPARPTPVTDILREQVKAVLGELGNVESIDDDAVQGEMQRMRAERKTALKRAREHDKLFQKHQRAAVEASRPVIDDDFITLWDTVQFNASIPSALLARIAADDKLERMARSGLYGYEWEAFTTRLRNEYGLHETNRKIDQGEVHFINWPETSLKMT